MRTGLKHIYNTIIINIMLTLGIVQLLEMSNMDTINNTVLEVTPEGVEITKNMTRDEQECWKYKPWTTNPKIIWNNVDIGSKRCERELVIYCKTYQEDIREYDYLLSGDKKISASKRIVLEYRQIYHPILL